MARGVPIGAASPMGDRPAWFRSIVGACDAFTRRRPAAGMRAAAAAGRLVNAGGLCGPAPRELARLFPWLTPAGARRLARQVAGEDLRSRAFDRFLQSGAVAEDVASRFEPGHLARLDERLARHPAAVLLTVHSGPAGTIAFVLRHLGRPALIVRAGERGTHFPGFDVATLEGDEQLRAKAVLRALAHLGRGLPVVIAADGSHGASCEPVPCCGGTIRFRRGPFVLARLARVPIVPLAFRWAGGGIEVEAGEPIFPPAGGEAGERERAMAAEAGAWLEGRLRARPGELSVKLLRCFEA